MIPIGIRLPEPLLLWYRKEAKKSGTTVNDRIRRALELYAKYRDKYEGE